MMNPYRIRGNSAKMSQQITAMRRMMMPQMEDAHR
jgi:hypothetical protein